MSDEPITPGPETAVRGGLYERAQRHAVIAWERKGGSLAEAPILRVDGREFRVVLDPAPDVVRLPDGLDGVRLPADGGYPIPDPYADA